MNFENTRPYTDAEVPAAAERLASSPMLEFFPIEMDTDALRATLRSCQTVRQFQERIMRPLIEGIVAHTSTGFTSSGFPMLDDRQKHLFLANHRDITLDAMLLQMELFRFGLDTCEVTFGSNLMSNPFIVDLGKINKMFRIERGGNPRKFYEESVLVSNYMRHAILDKNQSVWIAQRNGRTKDGRDQTEVGVLKMLSLSGKGSFVDNFSELSITPLCVSYEYEPCLFHKTQELFIANLMRYEKAPGEDINSILEGIRQPKGHIHLAVCPTLTREELEHCDSFEKGEKFNALARIIDQRIREAFHLWPTHYMAYDILHNTQTYASHYTPAERDAFLQYINDGIALLKGYPDELRAIALGIYAAPLM